MDVNLKADKRKVTGRKVKKLRSEGLVPANVYGNGVDSVSIQIVDTDFAKTYKVAGETSIVNLELDKEKRPVLIHNVQKHPVTGEVVHVDLLQVNLKKKVTTSVPVEIEGESPVEKSGAGTVVILLQELEIEALPMDIPEKFAIDATTLIEVDQTVKVGELKYDKSKVEVKVDAEEIVVKVEPPQKEEVIVAPVAETTEGEGEMPAEENKEETTESPEGEKPSEAQ